MLVIGGGTMGMLHVMLAHMKGANVILSEPVEERRKKALELGANAVIDPTKVDVAEEVKRMTDGLGAKIVFNTTAIPAIALQALDCTAKCGTMVMFSSLHPHSRSVLTAPSRSALVTSGFHSETTMPNFISAAEGSGASKCERFLVAIVQIVLFSVRISPQVSLRIRHANANRLPLAPYSLFILSSTTEAAIGPVRTPR